MPAPQKCQMEDDAPIIVDDDDDGGTGAAAAETNAFGALKRGAEAAAGKPPHAKRQVTQRELADGRWETTIKFKPYLARTSESKKQYVDECDASNGAKGTVTCDWCDADKGGKTISVGASTGNLTSHEGSVTHKAEARTHNEIAAQRGASDLRDHKVAMLSGAKKEELNAKLLEFRALTHAIAVSYGITPHNLVNLISPTGTVYESLKLLEQHHVKCVGLRQTVETDMPKAYDLVVEALKVLVKGTQGSLITDGGTLQKGSKGVVILYRSRSLPDPGVWPPGARGCGAVRLAVGAGHDTTDGGRPYGVGPVDPRVHSVDGDGVGVLARPPSNCAGV